jgi:hypothetical protein
MTAVLGVKRGTTVPSLQLAIVTVRVAPDPVAVKTQPAAVPAFEKSLLTMPTVVELSVSVYVSDAAFVGLSDVVEKELTVGPVKSIVTFDVESCCADGAETPSTATAPAASATPTVPSVSAPFGSTVIMYGPNP